MILKNAIVFLGLAGSLALASCAQSKSALSQEGKENTTFIEATSQRTMLGARGSEPITEYRFVLRWQSDNKPETFFWRDTDNWMPCRVSKISQIPGATVSAQSEEYWYTFTPISLNDVVNGDTLMLMPVTGGKYPVPVEIPADAVNTIFFKSTSSSWQSIPVTNIVKKPDVKMP